jgi:hypothetical protein
MGQVGGVGVLAEGAGRGRSAARVLTLGGGEGGGRGPAESAARPPRQHQAPPAAAGGAQLGKSKTLESKAVLATDGAQGQHSTHARSQPW